MFPKITIAISTRNGKKYLEKTLPAWLNQNYPKFNIIVIDDGSTDGTKDLLSNYKQVEYITQQGSHNGYSKTKNFCVSNANGEFIFLVDGDILPQTPQYLLNLYQTYINTKNIAFLSVSLCDSNNKDTKYYGIYYSFYGINIHKRKISISEIENHSCPIQAASFHGGGVFFDKNIWDQLGGYDTIQEFMLDDIDLSARACLQGYKVYIYNQEVLEHIGIDNHHDKKYFAWKYKYYFSGIATTMLKNLKTQNLYKLMIFIFASPLIYLMIGIKFKNISLVFSWFDSVFIFFKNIGKILKSRKIIQTTRKEKSDSFLSLKPEF